MRIAASLMFAITLFNPISVLALPQAMAAQKEAQAPSDPTSSAQQLFEQFGLFGAWAIDCKKPARPDNPHVVITAPTPEHVQEDHDLGPDYAMNRYNVLSAERISPTRLSVEVVFEPGMANEEKQRLVFLIRNDTRRTVFNKPHEGAARVKDGIVVARGAKTPLLRKCQ